MLTNVASVLAGLIGAGIIFVGARTFRSPQAAVGFGVVLLGVPAHVLLESRGSLATGATRGD